MPPEGRFFVADIYNLWIRLNVGCLAVQVTVKRRQHSCSVTGLLRNKRIIHKLHLHVNQESRKICASNMLLICFCLKMANPFRLLANWKSNLAKGDFKSAEYCGASRLDAEKQGQVSGLPDWGNIDSFCNTYGFYQENPVEDLILGRKHKDPLMDPDNEVSYDPDASFPQEQIVQLNNGKIELRVSKDSNIAATSLAEAQENVWNPRIANNYSEAFADESENWQKLSTDQILTLAGQRFVQFSSGKLIDIDMYVHPYVTCLPGLCSQDKQDVELAQVLLAAAEKVGHGQYDIASTLIGKCQGVASATGTAVQRAIFYLSEALLKRIRKETGSGEENQEADEVCRKKNILALVTMYQRLPLYQALHFAAAETFLENLKTKSRVHVIDFQISTGLQWPAFMQALIEQKLESIHLKITAIELADEPQAYRSGELLKSFARSLNLPFSYKVVFLPDKTELKEEHFEIKADEAVGLLFNYVLHTLISRPVRLQKLMTVVEKIRPLVMVVCETEANYNSPSFVNRFVETLFYCGAMFDSLEESMVHDNQDRMIIEQGMYRHLIHNIVSAEGYDRVTRSVSIDIWRAFFARFGMIELEVSSASLYQACWLVNQFPFRESCSLDVSSKCLLVGWKGTPVSSLSAWKFA